MELVLHEISPSQPTSSQDSDPHPSLLFGGMIRCWCNYPTKSFCFRGSTTLLLTWVSFLLCTFRYICWCWFFSCTRKPKESGREIYLYIFREREREGERATNRLVISMLFLSSEQSFAGWPCVRCLFDLDLLIVQLASVGKHLTIIKNKKYTKKKKPNRTSYAHAWYQSVHIKTHKFTHLFIKFMRFSIQSRSNPLLPIDFSVDETRACCRFSHGDRIFAMSF